MLDLSAYEHRRYRLPTKQASSLKLAHNRLRYCQRRRCCPVTVYAPAS